MATSDDGYPMLNKACDLANEGVEKEVNKDYKGALKLYEESTKYLLRSYNSEAKTNYIKKLTLNKYKEFQERMQAIDTILQERSCPNKPGISSKKND